MVSFAHTAQLSAAAFRSAVLASSALFFVARQRSVSTRSTFFFIRPFFSHSCLRRRAAQVQVGVCCDRYHQEEWARHRDCSR